MLKSLALSAISAGFALPDGPVSRVGELVSLRKLLALLRINCVIDVGANIGQFAYDLRGIGFTGRIVSFEPLSAEFAALSKAREGDLAWEGFQKALGQKTGSARIGVPKLSVMSSLLSPIREQAVMRYEDVQICRLDSMFPHLVRNIQEPRVLLKMDTQGYDLEVFHGARGCVDRICGLVSELSVRPLYERMPHYTEALGVYEAAGFNLYDLSVVSRAGDGNLIELNCFMRRS